MEKYTVPEFFAAFPEIKACGVAGLSGINPSLVRYYRTNPAASISAARRAELEAAIHELGRRLLDVRLA